LTPGTDLDADTLFGPVLGTHISPGGNHLVYRVNHPSPISVSLLIFDS
jgi:hypothetical protein